jgi:hypothetical protein
MILVVFNMFPANARIAMLSYPPYSIAESLLSLFGAIPSVSTNLTGGPLVSISNEQSKP